MKNAKIHFFDVQEYALLVTSEIMDFLTTIRIHQAKN